MLLVAAAVLPGGQYGAGDMVMLRIVAVVMWVRCAACIVGVAVRICILSAYLIP